MIGEKDFLVLGMENDRDARYWESPNRTNKLDQDICYQERNGVSRDLGYDRIQFSVYGRRLQVQSLQISLNNKDIKTSTGSRDGAGEEEA